MIKVRLNRQSFQYDVHSLVRAFYPGETVQVDCDGFRQKDDMVRPLLFFLEVFVPLEERGEIDIRLFEESEGELLEKARISGVPGSARSDAFRNSPEAAERRETKNELKRLLYRLLSGYSGKTLPWGDLTGIRPTKIPMALLNQGWQDDGIARYMRDTYYTGREKTALAIEIANRERSLLEKMQLTASQNRSGSGAFDRGYSLYIGIPFCPSICLYCSFSSSPVALWKDRVDAYLDTLLYEIDCVADMLPHNHPDTVYIGGGTPTTLEPGQMERLLAKLEERFDMAGTHEFTVEAGRPDSITREKLQVLKEHPVTRISINPQTMNQKTLDFIGRKHTTGQTMEAFFLAREMGFDNINMDLIVGLPGEGAPEVEHTMQVLSGLDPDSITVHSLAVKRAARLRLFKEEHQELNFENSSAIMDMTAEYARKAGLLPYYLYRQKNMAGNFENVGYARPGREGLYNILIMEEVQSIVALGAGASTKLVFPARATSERRGQPAADRSETAGSVQSASGWGQTRIERIENVKDIKNYMERIDEMIERKRAGFYV